MNSLQNLINILKSAKNIAILTGAGISAESGIATFRDPDGLWNKLNPAELASIDGFMANPKLVWEWYQHRVKIVNESKPNPGHYAIAEMQNIFPKVTVVTQNVDRLHQKAGSKDVIELHGNIVTNRCFDCSADYSGETHLPDNELPKCPKCGGKIRPNVVWFGEQLPEDAIRDAEIAAKTCEVFFSIGTSAEVYPAAGLPFLAKQSGARIVEINPNDTPLTPYVDFSIPELAGESLPIILEEYKRYKNEIN
jgi:NAD-dependent deacetylase